MNKDEFWTVERLLPRIHSTVSDSKGNGGIPLSSLQTASSKRKFGPYRRVEGSRVIRFYRLTDPIDPKNDLILENRELSSPPPFYPCNVFAPTMLTLDEKQRNYFFYFCRAVKERKRVPTSFAYLRLYLCKVSRLMDVQTSFPTEILWLWETYREEFPLSDRLFCDFISDFCFYKGETPPFEAIGTILTKPDFTVRPFLSDLYIFDYLFAPEHRLDAKEADFLLRHLTSRSFRATKAYRTNPRFAAALEDALGKALRSGLFNRRDLNDSLFSIQIPSQVHSVRAMFQGLPPEECPRMEINLCSLPLLHDENIRDRCDELIRYLENRLRSIMKMKNALSRIHISQTHKDFLEEILSNYLHLAPREETTTEIEFAKAEPRKLEIDPEKATKIEEESWTITRELTKEYLRDNEEAVVVGERENDEASNYENELKILDRGAAGKESEFWEFAAKLTSEEDHFMCLAVNSGIDRARTYALSLGIFFEAMISSCNEKAVDATGDAVMDGAGGVFEEYKRELEEVFPILKGE